MNSYSPRFTPIATNAGERRAVTAFGLWLRVTLVGAMMVAAGVAILVEHSASTGLGVFVVIVGGVVAFAGWRQGRSAFSRLDVGSSAAAPAARDLKRDARAPAASVSPILQ